MSEEQAQELREQIEEALWLQAEGKDYYKAPLSVRREILDIAIPLFQEWVEMRERKPS